MTLVDLHKHSGHLLLLLPLVVVVVAKLKGKTPLPRIVAVLLDIQLVVGLVTYFFGGIAVKPLAGLHVVCMVLALGLAHAFAKKDAPNKVAGAFAGVFVLILLGYLLQKGVIPNGGWMLPSPR